MSLSGELGENPLVVDAYYIMSWSHMDKLEKHGLPFKFVFVVLVFVGGCSQDAPKEIVD